MMTIFDGEEATTPVNLTVSEIDRLLEALPYGRYPLRRKLFMAQAQLIAAEVDKRKAEGVKKKLT